MRGITTRALCGWLCLCSSGLPAAELPDSGFAPSAGPAAIAPLSVAQLEEIALANNPTLAQAMHRVEALRGEQLQVGLYPNPVIGYQAEEVGDQGRAGQQGMFLNQEIVTAGKLGWNRAVAEQEIQQAQWDAYSQRQRVLNGVRGRAYAVLAAQKTIEVSRQLVEIGDAAVQAAERLYQAREVSQVDVLQARVQANTVRLQLAAAQQAHTAAWRQLAAVVGIPGLPPTELIDRLDAELPQLTWEDALAGVLAGSPQIARAYAGIERANAALARACAGRTPNLQTGASVRYNYESHDTLFSLQVGVPLQIHDRNQGNVLQARAELAAAHREVQRVELALQSRLAEVFQTYEIARGQVEQFSAQILPDAARSLELVRTGYQQGEFGYLELLTAQQTYSRTYLAYVERLGELRAAAVQLEGLLLDGGLDAVGP